MSTASSRLFTTADIDSLVEHQKTLGKTFIGNATLNEDFVRAPDGKDSRNYKYEIAKDQPYEFRLIGELLSRDEGTKIDAAGNYTGGPGAWFKPLQDGKKMIKYPKDVHYIKCPSPSSAKFSAQFANAIATLNSIHEANAVDDENAGTTPVATYDWMRSSDGQDLDIIIVNSLNKYGVPADLDPSNTDIIRKTVKVNVDDLDKSGGIEPADSSEVESNNHNEPLVGIKNHWWDPSVQPDFGGPFFDLKEDKLRQLEIYDIDGVLVHPARMYDVLRPGTILEYKCQAHVFNIKNGRSGGSNRYYQIQFTSADVLFTSDRPAECREKFQVPPEYLSSINNKASPKKKESTPANDLETFSQKRRAQARKMNSKSQKTPPSKASASAGSASKGPNASDRSKGKRKAEEPQDVDM